jgi:anti-sigma28 factor (negative regulator of flagellin synthesis)
MKKDFGKILYKLNQLKKRLKRSKDNEGHSTPLKDKIRLKRLEELKKEIKNGNRRTNIK